MLTLTNIEDDTGIVYQLTNGFWVKRGSIARKFDLGPDKTITVNIDGLTNDGKFLAREALKTWSAISGITFRETSSQDAGILFQDHDEGAYSRTTNLTSSGTIIQTVINVSTNWLNRYGTDLNSYSLTTYIHEIGHALGLGHPGDYNGSIGTDNVGNQFEADARIFTVMSYSSESDNEHTSEFALDIIPGTPMIYDIAAIWTIYGKPAEAINPGNNTYTAQIIPDLRLSQEAGFFPTISKTIVDEDGIDTLFLGDSDDIIVFAEDPDTGLLLGLGSIKGAPQDLENGKAAWNLIFIGEIEYIYGGAGDDIIAGGPAGNRLYGEQGDDIIHGGTGADQFMFQPGDRPDLYTDFIQDFNPQEGDRLNLAAYTSITSIPQHSVTTIIGTNSTVIDLDNNGYYDIVLYDYTKPLKASDFIFHGQEPHPTEEPDPNPTPTPDPDTGTIKGTPYDDNPLAGTSDNDNMEGLQGNDNIIGGPGNDRIDGGEGDDIIEGGPGADTLIGGNGTDTISYLFSREHVIINLEQLTAQDGDAQGDILNEDIENIYGSSYNDTLTGNRHSNLIFGDSGNDTIHGREGNDYLSGGPGEDTINGGPGQDFASYSEAKSGITVRLRTGTGERGEANGDSLTSIENLAGSNYNDILDGNEEDNLLAGFNGNDRIYGREGDDFLSGGPGADYLLGGPGEDTIAYTFSPAGVTVRLHNGTASGGHAKGDTFREIENISGSNYNDTLAGDEKDNSLFGLEGNDTLYGGPGNTTSNSDYLAGQS